ncbi:unnamed protein product [Ilex paraguariensis]|uniref:Uncharacterized protein n=1 Tax=Ilex paraguariensis TaxID=185542 RepID=A0ABC8R0N6_9AQUA
MDIKASDCRRSMAQFHNHELEYIVDDYYDTTDFADNPFEDDESPRSGGVDDSLDSYFEDDFELVIWMMLLPYLL